MNANQNEDDSGNEQEEILSDSQWHMYTMNMFPAKPLEGKLLALLKEELAAGFSFDPTKHSDGENEDDEVDMDSTADNFMKFCKMCEQEDGAGLAWLNAMHQFDKPDCDEKYTGDDEDEEAKAAFYQQMEQERKFGGKFTPLTYLLEYDSEDWRTAELLVEQGADPNLRDGMGEPPLYKLIEKGGRWKTANQLLNFGANPMAAYKGKTVALFAKEWAKTDDTVKMIWDDIKQKLDIHDEDGDDEDGDDEDFSDFE